MEAAPGIKFAFRDMIQQCDGAAGQITVAGLNAALTAASAASGSPGLSSAARRTPSQSSRSSSSLRLTGWASAGPGARPRQDCRPPNTPLGLRRCTEQPFEPVISAVQGSADRGEPAPAGRTGHINAVQ